MKVHEVEFAGSCFRPEEYPREGHPEVAFVGRSNVGKSSVINTLLHWKGVARVSSTPGKTRRIFFFKVNRVLYFVDLPGYGFAKVSKEARASWAHAMEQYFSYVRKPRGVVMLLDARHPPTALDLQMKSWMEHLGIPTVFVMTKMDKVRRKDHRKSLEDLRTGLGLSQDRPVYPFSAKTGEGREDLWRAVERLLPST